MIGERPSHQQLNLSFDTSCGVQNGLAGWTRVGASRLSSSRVRELSIFMWQSA